MYIAPGKGQTAPMGQTFDVNRNVMSLHSFVASFKKNVKSDFIQFFFMIQYMYIAPGQGQTAPRGQNFDVNRKDLSFYPLVASFIFFQDLIYSPGAGGHTVFPYKSIRDHI